MTKPAAIPGRTRRRAILAVATVIALAAFIGSFDALRWRTTIIGLKAAGQLEGIRWGELVSMLRPGSPFYLKPLRETPNAYAVIVNPYRSEADRESGTRLFQVWCAACHGPDGRGQTAPSLIGRNLKAGDSDWSLYHTVKEGRPDLGMPPLPVDSTEAWQLVGFVRNLRNGTALVDEATGAELLDHVDVPSARLEAAALEPANWLTYSGSYDSWRHSRLDEITTENVTKLKLAWSLQLRTDEEYVETSPIVVDGVMYLTAPPSDVLAVNAATGEVLWRYTRPTPKDISLCCGAANRGVAVLGDRVFVSTLDNYVIALDARNGSVIWSVKAADYKAGYSMTGAPLAARDKVIVGVAGGEYGIRGFLDAYDAATGKRAWRFETIPAPGQPGSETWGGGEAWKTGGGPTWVTGSFDPALGLVYWGVGNPAPDFNGDVRPGDNLYTNSALALDIATGELRWHFQFTPHDQHDWDSNQVPVLVDRELDGRQRNLMLWANRNGFYYVLDRVTGEFLHANAFVTQNWAERIDEHGRPMLLPTAEPSRLGTLTWPGLSGGGNWWSPSYSPRTDLIYVPFADAPKIYFKNEEFEDEPVPGVQFMGSASVHTGEPLQCGIRALDPLTGRVVWEYLRPNPRRNVGRIGGVLSTAGDVVFFGDIFDFVAFDAREGKELWRVNLGGHINASPVTFAVNGQQRVAIAAGNTIYVFRR